MPPTPATAPAPLPSSDPSSDPSSGPPSGPPGAPATAEASGTGGPSPGAPGAPCAPETPGVPAPAPALPSPRGAPRHAAARNSGRRAPEPPVRSRDGRLPALDGLRLVAALSVLLTHYFVLPGNPYIWGRLPEDLAPGPARAGGYGWLGVDFFFLISGFVICMSGWGRTVTQFFISRVVRLYPAYWLAVLLSAALIGLHPLNHVNSTVDVSPRSVLANLTMMPYQLHMNMIEGVAWSLWVEARFYLLVGVLLMIGMSYRTVVGFCGLWMMATLIDVEVGSPMLDELVMSQYSGLFVAGIAVFLMRRFGPNLVLWGLLGFAWLVELTMLDLRVANRVHETGDHLSWTVSAALLTAGLVLLLLVALGPLGRIRWRWLTTAGALTYPLYLLHQNLGQVMIAELHRHAGGLAWPVVLLLTVTAMLLLSWAVHLWVERPVGRRLKQGLINGLRPARE
jgi:peptidoglycan/LPS O-acetylase OafA/YrhL